MEERRAADEGGGEEAASRSGELQRRGSCITQWRAAEERGGGEDRDGGEESCRGEERNLHHTVERREMGEEKWRDQMRGSCSGGEKSCR